MNNTPEILAVEWIKNSHPKLYSIMVKRRPDLIREAYAAPVNGLSGMDGLFDSILGFAKEAVPIYQQQKVFSLQLKQAAAGAAPTPSPVKVVDPVVSDAEYRMVDQKYGTTIRGKVQPNYAPWIIGGVIGVGALAYFLHKKRG